MSGKNKIITVAWIKSMEMEIENINDDSDGEIKILPDDDSKTSKSAASSAWPNSKTLLLIDLYKSKSSLWDPSHLKYRDKKSRRHSLQEISSQVGGSVGEIERKIHGLRTQFLRECRRHYDNSTWFAYENMKFLLNIRTSSHVKQMKLEGNVQPEKQQPKVLLNMKCSTPLIQIKQQAVETFEEESYHDSGDLTEEQKGETDYEILEENCSEYEIASYAGDQSITDNRSVTIHSIVPNPKLYTHEEPSPSTSVTQSKDGQIDHLDTFGRYVTDELRNIRGDSYSVQVAKHKINQILFEASIGEFKRKK